MSLSSSSFRIELYREHLEEASFLYEQRNVLLADVETSWVRLDDFEERLEAHIDALIIGETVALDVCRERAVSGDAGELFAAVCVYCRHQDARLLAETWRLLDFNDVLKVRAVTDALKLAMPQSWYGACEQALVRGDERLVPILATVCGYRRIPLGEQIAQRVLTNTASAAAQTLWALSRLSTTAMTAKAMQECVQHLDLSVKAYALFGLLRADKREALRVCQLAAETEDLPQLALGLVGDRASAAILRKRLDSGSGNKNTIVALGLLGDLSVVRSLCRMLADEEFGDVAAQALYWITGAPLFEDAFVAEKIDEAQLFEHELQAWREHQQLPQRSDGKPFGETVSKLSRDPEIWNQWLTTHANQFNSSLRYRRGVSYSPQALLGCLLDGAAPYSLRQLAYEELVTRFGCEVPFEADWHVKQQRQALQEIAQWLTLNEARFSQGQW